MSKYCMGCGSPNESFANFCMKCGSAFGEKKQSTSSAPSQIESPITKTTKTPENDFSDEERDYIRQFYKTVSPLNIAKKLKPKNTLGVAHPFVKQISEYTRLLKKADVGGGDVVVGSKNEPEDEDDEEGGGVNLNEMPEINLEGLEIESYSSTRPEVLSFNDLMAEAQRHAAKKPQ
jgi:hypothetical protein